MRYLVAVLTGTCSLYHSKSATERKNMAKAKYTRQKDGYFQTKVWDGTYNKDGSKHRIVVRSKKSSKELEDKVNEIKTAARERQFVRKTDVTFQEYALSWMKVYKSDCQLNTRNMYSNIINVHFKALNCPIGSINRAHYLTCLNEASGARTKQQMAMVFKQVIKSAIRDKLLPASVMDEIFEDIRIKYKSPEKRPLTAYEKKALQDADFTLRERAFVMLIYGCGLRRGEAIAITRFDINQERHELSINKALAFDVNTPVLKDTKNYVHRVVPIPDITWKALQDYIATIHCTNIFHMADGSYITKSSLDRMWESIIRKMQLVATERIVGLTPHIFRHNYCASLCYKIPEISIAKIAELLGDSQKMVLEVYNHEISEKEKPAETVAQALAL